MNDNTPTLMQSEKQRAPWNKKTKIIPVNVSQCLSAIVDIEVPEDLENYDSAILSEYVREQIILPDELTLNHCPDCWYVDDFCVCL